VAARPGNRLTIMSPTDSVTSESAALSDTLDDWVVVEANMGNSAGGPMVSLITVALGRFRQSRPLKPVILACMDDSVNDSLGFQPVPAQHSILDHLPQEFRAADASLWMLVKPDMNDPGEIDLRRRVLAEVVEQAICG
jgi:hypothetical protein